MSERSKKYTLEKPLVSIVIPVYNGSNYLKRAIDSALNQDYPNIEILIVDDGSDDGGATQRIIQSCRDERIRSFRIQENSGVSWALNLAMNECRGVYFSWLSHDDEYLPGKISIEMELMCRAGYPEDLIVYSDIQTIDEKSRIIGKHFFFNRKQQECILPIFLGEINGCSLLIPIVAMRKVGTFDSTLRTVQDYDYWLRLSYFCRFEHISVITVSSREHPEQGCKTDPVAHEEASVFFHRLLSGVSEKHRKELDAFSPFYRDMYDLILEEKAYDNRLKQEQNIRRFLTRMWLKFDRSWNSCPSIGGFLFHPYYNFKILKEKIPVYLRKKFYR